MRSIRTFTALACGVLAGCGGLVLQTRLRPLEESVVFGDRGPKIVQLEIEGLITDVPRRTQLSLTPPDSLLGRVKEALDRAEEDDRVAALLLRIQSPGGTVSASDTLYHEVLDWKERTGLPVIAHLEGLATSGAYYVAMAADELIAHPATVTGSIGVLFAGINVSGLMEKLGIQDQSLTGGEYKDEGSPLRPMRPEERAQIQGVIDDFHARFREVVAAGRPGLDAEQVHRISDGRIFSSDQALGLRLVDRIGYLRDAIDAAEKRAGVERSRVVVYHRPSEYRDNIYSRSVLPGVPRVEVHLLPEIPPLAAGFYYLWPAVLESP